MDAHLMAGVLDIGFPLNASTRPCASIMATCRTSRWASAPSRRWSASGAATPARISSRPLWP
jgi:hypothetical protein